MFLYLGNDDLVSKTPYMNRITRGWFPNEPLSGSQIIMDRALLAVLIALYDKPLANWSWKNSRSASLSSFPLILWKNFVRRSITQLTTRRSTLELVAQVPTLYLTWFTSDLDQRRIIISMIFVTFCSHFAKI